MFHFLERREVSLVNTQGLTDPELEREFAEIVGRLRSTPLMRNGSLIQQAISYLDRAKATIPSEQRLAAYLGLYWSYAPVASPASFFLVARIIDTLDETGIPANQRIAGLSRILRLTPIGNPSQARLLMARIAQYSEQTALR